MYGGSISQLFPAYDSQKAPAILTMILRNLRSEAKFIRKKWGNQRNVVLGIDSVNHPAR